MRRSRPTPPSAAFKGTPRKARRRRRPAQRPIDASVITRARCATGFSFPVTLSLSKGAKFLAARDQPRLQWQFMGEQREKEFLTARP